MVQLIDWGYSFLAGLSVLGEFLFLTPLTQVAEWLYSIELLWASIPVVGDIVRVVIDNILMQPIAIIVVGYGLVLVVTLKIWQFVLKLLPLL